MKYIIESNDVIGYTPKYAMLFGDGYMIQPLEDLEELNSDYINKHFGDLQEQAYQKGLEDGRKESRTISLCDTCLYEYDGTGVCKMCRFGYGSQYKEKPKDDGIKVGDEVELRGGDKIFVTFVRGDKLEGLYSDGMTIEDVDIGTAKKTGKYSAVIADILKKMREE